MNNTDGAALSFIAGIFFLALVFIAGWESNNLIWSLVAFVIVFVVNAVQVYRFRPTRIWLIPLTFALPTLLVGLLALTGDIPTFFVIGSTTFFVGLTAAYIARKLTNSYSPPLTRTMRDEASRAGYVEH